jgi:GT2 family glycosyltransferase
VTTRNSAVPALSHTALVGYLQSYPTVSAVGFQGGLLSEDGIGVNANSGTEIDYIMGWCVCLSRELYNEFGLFDDVNLKFAYGEDSDFSLRLREAGKSLYVLTLELVKHHAHQTTAAIKAKRNIKPEFVANHEYVHRRWHDYLKENRILRRYPDIEAQIYETWNKQNGNTLNLKNLVAACL